MSSINFTARLVSNPIIKQRSSMFDYKKQQASIVELDCRSMDDIKALSEASDRWMGRGGKYIDDILDVALYESNMEGALYESNILNIKNDHFYALTTQKQNFDQLKPKNILGVMLFTERIGSNNEIQLLEVSPTTSKTKNYIRKYKQVGRRLVEYVQDKYSNKDIEVWADFDARNFYKKLGFKKKAKNVCDLLWKAVK